MATQGLSVLGVLAFVVTLSCSSTEELAAEGAAGGAGSGGTGAGGDAGAPNDPAIRWNDEGVISSDTNEFGIQGTWFFETDCDGAAAAGLPCTVPDATMVGPDGQPGWTTSADRVCAKGVAQQVTTDPMTGMPAYELQWGVRLGFDLNEDPTTGVPRAYDAALRGLLGFRFDFVSPTSSPPTLTVTYIATSLPEPRFFGTGWPFVEVTLPAVQQIVPFEVVCQDCSGPIDTTALTEVHFQVYTNPSVQKPFDFCISNARAVVK